MTGCWIRLVGSHRFVTQFSNPCYASNDDQPLSIFSMILVHLERLVHFSRRPVRWQSDLPGSQAITCTFGIPPTNFNRKAELNYVRKALISTYKHNFTNKYFLKTNKIFRLRNWIRHGCLILQTNKSIKVKEYIKWH